jgi:integrase
MTAFASTVTLSIRRYIHLQRALGYQFHKQAASLRAFGRHLHSIRAPGPLSQALALKFAMASDLTPNGRAIRYAVIRRFAQYHAAFDPRAESLDRRALPRSRAIPPPRILSEEELRCPMAASKRVSRGSSLRGRTLATVIGLLVSTGLRSGEALRLDRSDVDMTRGVLQIRKTKFRKDRLVPVHPTTLTALRGYAQHRDFAFPSPKTRAFFLSTRGTRLKSSGLYYGFEQVSSPQSTRTRAKLFDRMICAIDSPSHGSLSGIGRRPMFSRCCRCWRRTWGTPATAIRPTTSPLPQSYWAWLARTPSVTEAQHEQPVFARSTARVLLPPSTDAAT